MLRDRRTNNHIPEETLRQLSIGRADGQTPRGSNDSYASISEEDLQSSMQLSRGNFDKLMEYKNNNNNNRNLMKRKTSIMSNFAQFKSFQNNEFWLQSPEPATGKNNEKNTDRINERNNEKFPVPVTVEIDRFMLNYLEHPDVMSARSTATLQDEKNDSEVSNKTNESESDSFSSSEASSREVEIDEPEAVSPGTKTPVSVKTEEKLMKSLSLSQSQKEEQKVENSLQKSEKMSPLQQELGSPKEGEYDENGLPSDFESKLKDKLMEVAKIDLETIEEKHEEDHDMLTRGDLDYIDKIKIKALNSNTDKPYSEDNFLKSPNLLTTIVLPTSEGSPKSKQAESRNDTEINEFFSQKKQDDGNSLRINLEQVDD